MSHRPWRLGAVFAVLVLTTSAATTVQAGDLAEDSKIDYSTVGAGPQDLTPAELTKLAALRSPAPTATQPEAPIDPALLPLLAKTSPFSTVIPGSAPDLAARASAKGADAAPAAASAPAVLPKQRELTTSTQGAPGLNALEAAKAAAEAARQTSPAPAAGGRSAR